MTVFRLVSFSVRVHYIEFFLSGKARLPIREDCYSRPRKFTLRASFRDVEPQAAPLTSTSSPTARRVHPLRPANAPSSTPITVPLPILGLKFAQFPPAATVRFFPAPAPSHPPHPISPPPSSSSLRQPLTLTLDPRLTGHLAPPFMPAHCVPPPGFEAVEEGEVSPSEQWD